MLPLSILLFILLLKILSIREGTCPSTTRDGWRMSGRRPFELSKLKNWRLTFTESILSKSMLKSPHKYNSLFSLANLHNVESR